MVEKALVFWLWGMAACLVALVIDYLLFERKNRIHRIRVRDFVVSAVVWSWVGVAYILCDWMGAFCKWVIKRHNVFDEWER